MAEVTLKPLADRVVIEPLAQEEVTAFGIILPETAKEKPQKGTVIAAGPGKRDDKGALVPMEIQVGDVVLYAKYAGTELKLEGGKQVLVVRESDILAIVL